MRTGKRLGAVSAAAAAATAVLLLTGTAAGSPGELASDRPAAATGLSVSDGRLLESNGNDFVMRGVNHPHSWYPQHRQSLSDIKELGANTARVVLSSGHQWEKNDTADVASIVSDCKTNRLICVLEVHDTTGYGEEGAAVSLDQAADYWLEVRDALTGEEDHVIVNLGNEPFGNSGDEAWSADTQAAIQKLRGAGFDHALMVDAPNWGQDWTFTMRDSAEEVFASDPQSNTLFSIHMYGVFDQASTINDYLNAFVDAGLPILIGEFGHDHSDGDPDEDTIMATAQSLGLGYLGWSYSGNSGGVDYLDLVENFDPDALTDWGQRFFHGPDGITETAEEATVYGGVR